MVSAAEAEVRATYANAQEDVPIRTALIDPKHQQSPTPIKVENSTAIGSSNKTNQAKTIQINIYIYNSIGSNTAQNKDTSKYTGGQEKATLDITTQSTSHIHTTS